LRALVIDDRVPVAERDAGSNAVLSHMRSLQRLGYEVVFVPADMQPGADPGWLDAAGIACCAQPWHGSVEEILCREAGAFDLVYLHRVTVATKYTALVRQHLPRARLIYSVADLHALRLARQAAAEQRPELEAAAHRMRVAESVAAWSADVVVTHSPHEAALLRQAVPGANVHVVPWGVTACPTVVPFAARHGVAFIGHYGHSPNVDAALWLADTVMPLLRARDPDITCLLVGSDMPDELRRERPGVVAVGQVAELAEVFDRVRVTVAPLRFGAGVKGKVVASLAAGVPCICTPIAAEGLDLPELLQAQVAADADGVAAALHRLHADARLNAACREAGLAFAATSWSQEQIDTLMREVAGLPVPGAVGPGER
jgi:glycosyltransferase involved in cell wall biosynthesis